jgi:hypothetical protein
MNIFAEAGSVNNLIASPTAMGFLKSILGTIMYMSIPVIGVVLVYAGFMFVFARGNSEKIRTATYNLAYIAGGIALVLGAYMIANVFYDTIVKGILGF